MNAGQDGSKIPPQLELLLTGISDNGQRMAVVQAYYGLAEGGPNTRPVQSAGLIKAHTLAMNQVTQANRRARGPPTSTTPTLDLQPTSPHIPESAAPLAQLT